MTDSNGQIHTFTNQHPSASLVNEQKGYAKAVLPPQFAELVELTEKPFIQAITDVLSRQTVFCDGRVVFVGDAVAGFRPHTAASTNQAAFHALRLNDYLRREKVDWKAFEREVRQFAVNGVTHGIQLGNRSQFE